MAGHIYVQLSQKKYTYSCMLYFVGKTGVPVQEILTSNAVSLNLKICIYIYVENKYPERRTIWYFTSYLYHIYNYKEYIFWNKECNTIRWPPTYGEMCISLFLIYKYKFVCTSSFKNSIITNLIWFCFSILINKICRRT